MHNIYYLIYGKPLTSGIKERSVDCIHARLCVRQLTAILLSMIICLSFVSCSAKDEELPSVPTEACEMLILASTIPGSMLLPILEQNKDSFENSYTLSIGSVSDNMMTSVNGDYDVVSLPLNLAYYLYNRSDKNTEIVAITRTSGISLITENSDITDITELAGKSVYTVSDTICAYVFEYIADHYGIEFEIAEVASYAELEALLGQGNGISALCEQPYTASILSDNTLVREIADINSLWKDCSGLGYDIPCDVLVINKKFSNANPTALKYLNEEYAEIHESYRENIDTINNADILDGFPIDEDLLNTVSLVYISGNEMKTQLTAFSSIIYDFNPDFAGGELPSEDIYRID